jgi:hypothetical protein
LDSWLSADAIRESISVAVLADECEEPGGGGLDTLRAYGDRSRLPFPVLACKVDCGLFWVWQRAHHEKEKSESAVVREIGI